MKDLFKEWQKERINSLSKIELLKECLDENRFFKTRDNISPQNIYFESKLDWELDMFYQEKWCSPDQYGLGWFFIYDFEVKPIETTEMKRSRMERWGMDKDWIDRILKK